MLDVGISERKGGNERGGILQEEDYANKGKLT